MFDISDHIHDIMDMLNWGFGGQGYDEIWPW